MEIAGITTRQDTDADKALGMNRLLSTSRIANFDLTILDDYDDPEDVAEWRWIQSVASFSHRHNGKEQGVWEFVVNLSMTLDDIPPRLAPVLDAARREGAAYVLFHQG